MTVQTYSVPGMHCGHCVRAITESVGTLAGVEAVEVDLAAKSVRVTGEASEPQVRAAIADAGYNAG